MDMGFYQTRHNHAPFEIDNPDALRRFGHATAHGHKPVVANRNRANDGVRSVHGVDFSVGQDEGFIAGILRVGDRHAGEKSCGATSFEKSAARRFAKWGIPVDLA
jgi:hypothetical protein